MNEILLRRMIESDLPAADELRRLAGWNQTPDDWRALLELEPHGCFVALKGAELVGTVTTTTYGRALAWIGMMLVHPEHRRQGIAARLMDQALEYLCGRNIPSVGLDATPAGLPLYEKLGFVAEWTFTRWQRAADAEQVSARSNVSEVREPGESDWPALVELDAATFGVPRPQLIKSLARRSLAALVWPAQGQPVGWGLLRPGANAHYLAPLTCMQPEGALSLVEPLLGRAFGSSVFWDIPDQNRVAKGAAERFGFTRVRPLTRMRLGPGSTSTDAGAQFAIADPAVG